MPKIYKETFLPAFTKWYQSPEDEKFQHAWVDCLQKIVSANLSRSKVVLSPGQTLEDLKSDLVLFLFEISKSKVDLEALDNKRLTNYLTLACKRKIWNKVQKNCKSLTNENAYLEKASSNLGDAYKDSYQQETVSIYLDNPLLERIKCLLIEGYSLVEASEIAGVTNMSAKQLKNEMKKALKPYVYSTR